VALYARNTQQLGLIGNFAVVSSHIDLFLSEIPDIGVLPCGQNVDGQVDICKFVLP
jgi:hypothetical protein